MPPLYRLLVLLLILCLLVSCATPYSPPQSVRPQRPSPETCQKPPPEPRLPPGATLVRPDVDDPRTDPEGTATTLNWMSEVLEWGRGLYKQQAKRSASSECRR